MTGYPSDSLFCKFGDNMKSNNLYPCWMVFPLGIIYGVFYLFPTVLSFFFSLTTWTLDDWSFVGLYNFQTFFSESYLSTSIKNTMIFAIVSCLGKTVLGFLLAVYLEGRIRAKNLQLSFVYFPHLLCPLAIGLAFSSLMHPTDGLINSMLNFIGVSGPDWLGNSKIALYSVIFADVWKDIGVAVIIFLAGIRAISKNYYEAAAIDGGTKWQKFRWITLPLARPSINTVIILSFIGGMRTFDMVWSMTKGGPGYDTDVLASAIYKQYAGGYYGLATAGNVIMLLMISIIAFPLYKWLINSEKDYEV